MFLSSTRRGMVLEVFLSPGSRPSAGVKGICCSRAFDPCSSETPEGDGGRRSLKPIQQTTTSTAATPTAVPHRPTFNGMRFARFNAAQAERVSAGNFSARAIKVPQGWYIARFVDWCSIRSSKRDGHSRSFPRQSIALRPFPLAMVASESERSAGRCALRESEQPRSSPARTASWRHPGKDSVFGDQCGHELAHRKQVEKSLLGKALARPDLVRGAGNINMG